VTTDTRGLEHVVAGGFSAVALAIVATFPAGESSLVVAQLLAVGLPTLALLGVRRSRRKESERTEIAVADGGDRR